jgi:2,3-bisphosphoglycerate-dependent phosphoglycerate mutase
MLLNNNLILIRHGQSDWNLKNLFTGWTDVDLTDQGRHEAKTAGALLKAEQLIPDVALSSVLKRAIRTAWIVLDEMDLMWVPLHHAWELNERHYGALQGLDKAATVQRHGEEQVKIWRRSYDIPPPALSTDDPRHPCHDARYQHLDPTLLPGTESLKDTLTRVLPYWERVVAPALLKGQRVLIVAHGNSLRALVKMLDGMSEAEIIEFNIPTGVPIVYNINAQLKSEGRRFLGDPEEIAKAALAVAQQTAKKS